MYQIRLGTSFDSDDDCSPNNCWCSHYDNPYDNYYHSHQLNPAHRYFFWIQEWKNQFKEINEDCRKLGLSSYSKDYVQGVLDSVSPEYPLNRITIESQEESSLFDFEIPD